MKDTIISMSITLFVLSVLVMAGTDNEPIVNTNSDNYGYGYGYGYGDTTTLRTSSGSRHRDNSYTTTFNMKIVPANDGFDYDSISRPNKTEETNEIDETDIWNPPTDKTGVTITIPAGEEDEPENEPEKQSPLSIIFVGMVLLSILLVLIKEKLEKKVVSKHN